MLVAALDHGNDVIFVNLTPPRAIKRRRWARGLEPWQKLARMVRFGQVFWFMLSVGQNMMNVLNITLCTSQEGLCQGGICVLSVS